MRKNKTTAVLRCDRCGVQLEHDVNEGQGSEAAWTALHIQGGNPSSVLKIGDGYKCDLCPDCSAAVLTLLNAKPGAGR